MDLCIAVCTKDIILGTYFIFLKTVVNILSVWIKIYEQEQMNVESQAIWMLFKNVSWFLKIQLISNKMWIHLRKKHNFNDYKI